MLTSCKISKI